MVAFIGGKDEEGVALVDTGGLEVGEKRSEGGVIVAKLLYVRSFARPEGAFRAEGGPFVVVVGIRDVREHYGDPFLQHGLNHRQRLSRLRTEV